MKIDLSQYIEIDEYLLKCSIGEIISYNRYYLGEDEESLEITEDLIHETIIDRFVEFGLRGMYVWDETLPYDIFEKSQKYLSKYLHLLDN